MPTYYPINEDTARNAHDMHHMGTYKTGSATAEYRAQVDKAAALVDQKKTELSAFYHDKLDSLLDSYSRRLAGWYNDYNRNAAAYPSQFISGAGNYNMRKHEKQMSREDSLWKEYEEISGLLHKIRSTGTGGVDLADPEARAQLLDQLNRHKEALETAKAANAYYRKHKTLEGCPGITAQNAHSVSFGLNLHGSPFPSYELSSIRGKIKRLEARLAELDALEAEKAAPADALQFDGGQIVRNAEENRLQIIFDDIPDAGLRQELKSYGFRWSPRNKAWQRQLTRDAEWAAKKILGIE